MIYHDKVSTGHKFTRGVTFLLSVSAKVKIRIKKKGYCTIMSCNHICLLNMFAFYTHESAIGMYTA